MEEACARLSTLNLLAAFLATKKHKNHKKEFCHFCVFALHLAYNLP